MFTLEQDVAGFDGILPCFFSSEYIKDFAADIPAFLFLLQCQQGLGDIQLNAGAFQRRAIYR